ncbi:MAG: division/cell wall cluster transcriptional repressor MraZ [Pseudomonadota bacterium]
MLKFFSSSATNKVDGKGRVSIPAPFRKVLQGEGSPVLFLMPEIRGLPAIEGYGQAHFEKLAGALSQMNPLSPEYDALADVVAGQAQQLPLDDTGRIVLPAEFRELAGITDSAFFVGRVNTFQIWAPERYAAIKDQRRETAVANFDKLPWGGGAQ